MWYGGHNGSNDRIIYCTSANGTDWSNHEMVIDKGDGGTYGTSHANAPTVIKDGSTYKMWYTGSNGSIWRIIYSRALKIGGSLSDAARIIILDESDWSIINNEEKSAGSYYIPTTSGAKMVVARKSDGEVLVYGNVDTTLT
jgi:hypothetical protein